MKGVHLPLWRHDLNENIKGFFINEANAKKVLVFLQKVPGTILSISIPNRTNILSTVLLTTFSSNKPSFLPNSCK